MTPIEQARAAVKAARDFEPAGERCTAEEVETLNRLCRDAYLACQAAGTSIGALRVALYREEREEHRKKLEAICAEFKAAALARTGKEVA
jgi:NADPH-dependent 7-cyano-7-deazaguanine reductase QueF